MDKREKIKQIIASVQDHRLSDDLIENAVYKIHVLFEKNDAAPERWTPEKYDRYWTVSGNGELSGYNWCDYVNDENFWKMGNCFRSKNDAEHARDKVRDLLISLHKAS